MLRFESPDQTLAGLWRCEVFMVRVTDRDQPLQGGDEPAYPCRISMHLNLVTVSESSKISQSFATVHLRAA